MSFEFNFIYSDSGEIVLIRSCVDINARLDYRYGHLSGYVSSSSVGEKNEWLNSTKR